MPDRCDHCGFVIADDEQADVRYVGVGPAATPIRRLYHAKCAWELRERDRKRGVISNDMAFAIIFGTVVLLAIGWAVFL